ncbi:AAA family ATPase [Patescibacteria group bacterium]|nr:AAA family ATPase [Patescibacteria group bacterium]
MKKSKIHWIFFTGGPCGGKSTLLNKARQYLEQRGWKVFVIHEAATFLFGSGLSINANHLSGKEFQEFLIRYQLMVQAVISAAAAKSKNDKVVILCDRSVIDGEAYVGKKMFQELLKEQGLTKFATLHDNDPYVIHCETAAIGALEAYSFANNPTRTETPELARKKDQLLHAAYNGVPHKSTLKNIKGEGIEEKCREGIRIIMHALGEPVPTEHENKYLVPLASLDNIKALYDPYRCIIRQDYLKSRPGVSERIRQRGRGNEWFYYHTIKKPMPGGGRYEDEQMINRQLFNELLFRKDEQFNQIKKDRYCFSVKGLYFEFDHFKGKINEFDSKKYGILEIETTSANPDIKIPHTIKVVKEVTHDPAFSNVELARKLHRPLIGA